MNHADRALVIVDLQNEFLSPDGRYPILESSKQSLLTNLATLVPDFRKSSGRIIWIKSVYENNPSNLDHPQHPSDSNSEAPSPTRSPNVRDHDTFLAGTHVGRSLCCEAGSTNAELHPAASALVADSDDILIKRNYSAFKETTLLSTLRAHCIGDIYLCGLLSNICILATLIDAVQIDGLKVHAISDCLGWRRKNSHLRALDKMNDMGVDVVTCQEACAEKVSDGVLSTPELYYVNGSIPSWRVQLALYEKGIEVNQIRMKVMSHPKPTRLPAFLAINHRGKTPVFIDTDKDRTTVNESLAVLMYIETYYPDTPLLPALDQRKYRARILSLIQETENLHNAYDALEEAFFDARDFNTTARFNTIIRPPLLQSLYKELAYWETYTSKSAGFIGSGEEFTLADCAFYPILGYMLRRGFKFDEKWPGLQRYHAMVWERQSAKMAQPEGWAGIGKTNVFRGT